MNRQYNKRKIIDNVFLRWMYILILCLGSLGTYAQQQTYPVQVYSQLTPPYTPHIPAYYTGVQAKLKVMLINTDMQQPLVRVYLRMKILSSSLSLVTPSEVYTAPVELQAGVPLSLSLNDLEPYFKKENLRVSGGQSEFYRTQMLPDNFYRFHFEVYEEGTNRLVSNPKIGFAQAMIASGEPPILNLPLTGSVIKENNIPSIMFSWTPRHMNSVAAAYGAEYDISLVEIYDKQVAPEAAFDYSRVLYTETTRSTSFIHTVAQPLLIPGMRYAWRVQAKAREGVDEISVFKNNGFSPVSWFDYTADCNTVQSCGAIYESGHVDISWQDVGAMEYTVEYRKKGTSRWYAGPVSNPLLCQLYSLQAGKDYEYRIGSRCVAGDAFQYNDLHAFHVPDREENGPNCGLMPDINLTNQTPARELQSGMPVLVGDFPVFITSVSGSGKFTGEGYVGIPYLQGAQIAVTFKNIVVNTDNRLVEGFFETKYDTKNNNLLFDADQYQTGGKGVGDIRTGEEQAAFKVDYTINPDIKALPVKADGTKDEIAGGKDYTIVKGENGKYTFILTDSEGKEHKVEADSMPATIEDKEGNTYEVNEKGEVKPVSKVSDIKLDSSTKDTQSKLATLSFKATKNTKYALDEYRDVYEKVTEYNDQYKAEGTAITASAKFMLPGASDEIAVYIKENKENKLLPEKIRFVTGKGREYPATYDNQTKEWTLTIVGGQANDGLELYAIQEVGKDKYETLGKLNIFTYEPLNRSVTLVPVNGKMNNLDKQTVQNGLNEIYGKVGIHWTVNVLDQLQGTKEPFSYTPKNGSTFNVTGSGLLSMFTDDMKAINEAFKTSGEYQEDGLYLFVIGDKASESGTEGDMPLGSQFGYLFPGATIRTIAHEVGHGAFNLEHPFDRPLRISFPEKSMLEYNLMDYPTKNAEKWTELVKIQWDATRAPGHIIGLFQKDKSGMINTSIHLALSPNGILMDKFYLTENNKEKNIAVTLGVEGGHYTIDKIKYNNLYYDWDNIAKCFRNGTSTIIAKKDTGKPDKVNLFRHTGESCKYEYLEIAWNSDDENNPDVEQTIRNKIPENVQWVLYPYTERDLSCDNNFIKELLTRDRQGCSAEDVTKGDKLLRDNLDSTDPVHMVNVVNSVCLSSLRKLSYEEKTVLFVRIAKQESLKENSELALLRIMNALYTDDYKAFYKLLEDNNNELVKHLVSEIDDASIWFWTDKSNYTNFIGALVTMFNQNAEAIANRWPAGEVDFTQRVINLNPIEYSRDVSSVFAQSYTDKYNNGEYDGNTGYITLYDVYKMTVYGGDLTLGQNSVSHESRKEKLTEISPLTPIIIIPEKDKIPLVEAALDGYGFGNGAYIVPAIFLKYNADKIRNDYIEKGIVTTLDVATIAASGGTALATKVHWVRRAWAIMEVAGAVGDITVNVVNTNPEMKSAIDAYNMAMGVIGIKNVGKGIVNFAKNLPEQTRLLLAKNQSLRNLIIARYLDWKIAVTNLDNLTDAERKLIREQEIVWNSLDVVNDAARVAGQVRRFTQKQISDYLIFATKNPEARKVMLGKYLDGGNTSYIARAGKDHTYFDMGMEKWAEAEALVNKNADEMWRINKQFIDEQKSLGKEFYFSYEPWIVQSHEYLSKEAEYLIDLGAKDFLKINDNTWKVIW